MVEIIPHEGTSETIKNKTRDLMSSVGQKPVMLNREIDGFVLNRIQFAVNNEAYRLVDAGICSPKRLYHIDGYLERPYHSGRSVSLVGPTFILI